MNSPCLNLAAQVFLDNKCKHILRNANTHWLRNPWPAMPPNLNRVSSYQEPLYYVSFLAFFEKTKSGISLWPRLYCRSGKVERGSGSATLSRILEAEMLRLFWGVRLRRQTESWPASLGCSDRRLLKKATRNDMGIKWSTLYQPFLTPPTLQ